MISYWLVFLVAFAIIHSGYGVSVSNEEWSAYKVSTYDISFSWYIKRKLF